MKTRNLALVMAIAAIAPAGISCGNSVGSYGEAETAGPAAGKTGASTVSDEQILAQRAREVFSSIPGKSSETPDNLITASQLDAMLQDPAAAESIFILDTRPAIEWEEQGHIEGATWIRMQALADPENLERLPKDRLIVCVSPTGHTAVQVVSVLRWLGYDAVALKHGMAAWTQTPAGELMTKEAEDGMSRRYPVATETPYTQPVAQEPSQGLSIPTAEESSVLTDAALKLLHEDVYEKEYPFNHIFAEELFQRMNDPARKDSVFILDIRPLETWQRDGHIDMGNHLLIDWRELGKPQNLAILPKDKLIVVVGATGQTAGQATAILRMSGYNAVTLRSGMTAWTETPDSKDTLTTISSADYPVVK